MGVPCCRSDLPGAAHLAEWRVFSAFHSTATMPRRAPQMRSEATANIGTSLPIHPNGHRSDKRMQARRRKATTTICNPGGCDSNHLVLMPAILGRRALRAPETPKPNAQHSLPSPPLHSLPPRLVIPSSAHNKPQTPARTRRGSRYARTTILRRRTGFPQSTSTHRPPPQPQTSFTMVRSHCGAGLATDDFHRHSQSFIRLIHLYARNVGISLR